MRKLIILSIILILFSCKKETKKQENHSQSDLPVLDAYQFTEKNNPDEIARYKQEIQQYSDTLWSRTPDLSGGFLVAKNGEIIFEHYQGYADLSKQTPIDANTPIHIASVSKTLTSAVILRLINAEKLGLDDKVQKILPQFPYPDITVRMLLNHRSGLPKYEHFTEDATIWDKTKTLHNQDIVNLLAKHKLPLMFKPDTHFTYCNTNYAVLALIVEKITKMDFRTAMKKMVFEPLDMKNTYVFDLAKDSIRSSQSYIRNNQLYKFNYLDDIYGDKNVYSTPRDLLKFDLARYNPTFLSEDLQKQVFKGYSYEKDGVKNYGLGTRMKEYPNGKTLYYHNGLWHGNNASYYHLKDEHVTIISLGNVLNRNIYSVLKLVPLFGDYPVYFDLEKDENEPSELEKAKRIADSLKRAEDSIKKLNLKKQKTEEKNHLLKEKKDSTEL